MIEVSYVGVHNTRQVAPNMLNLNQVNPAYLSLGYALLTSPATAASLAKAGAALPYTGFKGTVAQALRPYPQYSTLTSVAAKVGKSTYNAAEVVFKKRLSFGLTLNANYTYSKILGYESATLEGNQGTDNAVQNAYDPQADYSILPEDVRHALVLDYSYQLPFGAGKPFLSARGFSNALAGGWTVSAIQRYQSGFPLSILMSSNELPIFNRYQRPNQVSGVSPSSHVSNSSFNPAVDKKFNPVAFSSPGDLSFGDAPVAQSGLRNFPVLNEDVQLTKRTMLPAHIRWSFYAQAFNVFNRHRFAGFGTKFGASSFGVPTATSSSRALQFGTRFQF